MDEAATDVVAIETYIEGLINLDAATVAEVAPIAAQAVVEFSSLVIATSVDPALFLPSLLEAKARWFNTIAKSMLEKARVDYEGTLLSVDEVLQEIILTHGL